MPRWIERPTIVAAAGDKPKQIEEFVGRVNSGDALLSVARMRSPGGWHEPGQTPEFIEVTHVLRGELHVEHSRGTTIVRAGQTIVTEPGNWVRYSTPLPDGAEYVAVCAPAFSPATVHRDVSPTAAPGAGSTALRLIEQPTTIIGEGNQPIRIDEFVGRVNSQDARLSVARLWCPPGWFEPPQQPDFLEVTLVLSGVVHIKHAGQTFAVKAGQAIITEPGERIQYCTPPDSDADYVAVCVPAFSMEGAHRDTAASPSSTA
ncbi:MAG: AraC family ligand binding domain-containing protein [Planctomycetaceae bacterium]